MFKHKKEFKCKEAEAKHNEMIQQLMDLYIHQVWTTESKMVRYVGNAIFLEDSVKVAAHRLEMIGQSEAAIDRYSLVTPSFLKERNKFLLAYETKPESFTVGLIRIHTAIDIMGYLPDFSKYKTLRECARVVIRALNLRSIKDIK